MKRIFFIILFFILFLFQATCAMAEPTKIMSLDFDDNSSIVNINMIESQQGFNQELKYSKLDNPNRIYFDIDNSVLIGGKKDLIFEKSDIKEIKISQFTTDPDVVRVVINFEENFDTTRVKLFRINDNIVLKLAKLQLNNDYFNSIYNEFSTGLEYSSLVVNSQAVQKVEMPQNTTQNLIIKDNTQNPVVADIERAFENSTINTDTRMLDSVVSVDLSSNLKLRTKYYISDYYSKNGGLLVNGIGQYTVSKIFYLDNPNRVVIDLTDTYVNRGIRNKELNICSDGSCPDTARIGQFEYNKARLVITSEHPEKYIPIYSSDSQSFLFFNADKLKHTDLVNCVSNLGKGFVRNVDSKTRELILSFTNPVVSSFIREKDSLNLYFFNVKSYNEIDLIQTLKNTDFKDFTISLLPQIGIKATKKLDEGDLIKIDQSIDGKAIKLTYTKTIDKNKDDSLLSITSKRSAIKGKIVLDAGHGGSDYGAIREGINEKDITLDVTQRVASILKSKGYKVALTRSDDTYVSLQDRVDFSEKETPQIFVSIHVNSAVATEPRGIETHYYHEYSEDLAKIVHKNLIKNIDTKDRGLFKSKFYVINHTTVPAILVEMGFISNDDERAELVSDSRKKKTAKAIAEGIIEYIKLQSK